MPKIQKLFLTASAFSMIALAGCNNAGDETNVTGNNTRNVGYVDENRNTTDDFLRNSRNADTDRNPFDYTVQSIERGNGLGNLENARDGGTQTRNVNNDDRDRVGSNGELSVADKAASRVMGLREVRRASVIVTGDNAYVAAQLENADGNNLTREVEHKIARAVRATNANVHDVYVSTNPDFIERMGGYVNDIQSGRPIGGLRDEFSETVRRVFPTSHR